VKRAKSSFRKTQDARKEMLAFLAFEYFIAEKTANKIKKENKKKKSKR